MRVLIAGGGTAGHINPALAILSIIKQRDKDAVFLYAGTPDGMESKLVPRANVEFAPIKVSGFQRHIDPENIVRNIKAVGYLAASGGRARKIIKGFEPDIVIGTGGYVSGPVVYTAQRMHIPTVIHEQNAYPGVTTRLLAKKANGVMLTMEEAAKYMPGVSYTLTGLPVRKAFDSLPSREDAKRELGLDEDALCIFSFGGSLGAGAINDSAVALLKWEQTLDAPVSHIHSYGRMGHDTFMSRLAEAGIDPKAKGRIIEEFIYNMDTCMAAADLIICRAGASAISELEAAGRASVLIPSPVVAGNHQYHNAMTLATAGAAEVIEQKDLTDELIVSTVSDLIHDPAKLRSYEQKAASCRIKDTADRIYEVIRSAVER
ncbi:MAG: undecaprenyldiphospho-muramoylpentapeptide beta-N-acetylglucosaminyltransferase [Oscillospiraceae bacterium]|nr:undecaprenyldiphospho-muramoylpentapeptide beta-N-acetylglucosaminyltransferase [Oscillospiraceae bacterium]